MESMRLLLITIPNCNACIRIKNNLDVLVYSKIETPFTYEVFNAVEHPELVEKYEMQSAPLLIFPNGYVLRFCMGISSLEELIVKQYKECLDSDRL